MEAYEKGNISDVAEMYTEDCRVMPAGGHILVGRDGNNNDTIATKLVELKFDCIITLKAVIAISNVNIVRHCLTFQ